MRWLVILSLLASCKAVVRAPTLSYMPPRKLPIVWHFKCDFMPDRKPEIREAFAWWQRQLGARRLFLEVPCYLPSELNVRSTSENYIDESGLPNFLVMGTGAAHEILLYLPWVEESHKWLRTNIIRHEIGHILSFAHSKDYYCLMYYEIGFAWWDEAKDLCDGERATLRALYSL